MEQKQRAKKKMNHEFNVSPFFFILRVSIIYLSTNWNLFFYFFSLFPSEKVSPWFWFNRWINKKYFKLFFPCFFCSVELCRFFSTFLCAFNGKELQDFFKIPVASSSSCFCFRFDVNSMFEKKCLSVVHHEMKLFHKNVYVKI